LKILLFGGAGQLGFELQLGLTMLGETIVPGLGSIPRVDLAKPEQIEHLIATVNPDIVVNAAAYTAVDNAEADPATAMSVNAEAPAVMARQLRKMGAMLIHYSTDYVFDGRGQTPHAEEDATLPLNVYGQSKLAGEAAIQKELHRHLIFRTSWVYSVHGKNFPKTMIKLAQTRDSLSIVCDQMGAPTHTAVLSNATTHAIACLARHQPSWGLYHLAASGAASWFDFAKFILERAKHQGLIEKIPQLVAVPSSSYPQIAKRPQNSRLNTSKFQKTFQIVLPDWQLSAEHFVCALSLSKR
jgi:dTDP-4-dehydrorhamnose reductase